LVAVIAVPGTTAPAESTTVPPNALFCANSSPGVTSKINPQAKQAGQKDKRPM